MFSQGRCLLVAKLGFAMLILTLALLWFVFVEAVFGAVLVELGPVRFPLVLLLVLEIDKYREQGVLNPGNRVVVGLRLRRRSLDP